MNFDTLGLAPRLVMALHDQNITDPTPIQTGAIPPALEGRDVLGLAETGSGKTAAFGLPLLDRLMKQGQKPKARMARALVLAPTRELARQISDTLHALAKGSHLSVALITGGVGFTPQIERLARGVAVLVATPGRLIDLLDRGSVSLAETQFLVLDEADQMLDMGFIHALRKIATLLPKDRQTMLFSATMPKEMEEIAAAYLREPVRVEVNPPGRAVTRIEQSLHFVAQKAKADLLIELLAQHRDERALLFGRTKHGSDKLAKVLENAGFGVAAIHGNKSQGQRDRAIAAFKAGEVKVLVATDVAARGLDIPDVRHVYNVDLPNVPEAYVHRIGRTARAGADGKAVAFCAPDEMVLLKDIEKAMKAKIPVASGAPWTGPETMGPRPGSRQPRPQGQAQRQSFRDGQGPKAATPAAQPAAKPVAQPARPAGPRPQGKPGARPGARPGGHPGAPSGRPRRAGGRPQAGGATAPKRGR